MQAPNDISIEKGFTELSVKTPYSWEFVDAVKNKLGGTWDPDTGAWILPLAAEKALRKTLISIFGKDDQPTELCNVHIKVLSQYEAVGRSVEWWGRTIAKARNRDSGATVPRNAGVAFLTGEPHSGGSRARWKTIIDAGSEIEVYNVPVRAVFSRRYKGIEVTVFDEKGEKIGIH